jgi:hypothetical protein
LAEIAKQLIAGGADQTLIDVNGKTAADLALNNNQPDTMLIFGVDGEGAGGDGGDGGGGAASEA